MRRGAMLLTLVAGLSATSAAEVVRREPAARVAEALRGVRVSAPLRALTGAQRIYVVVRTFTGDERVALERAGLAIELPAPGAAAPPWRSGFVVQGWATMGARATIRKLPFVDGVETPGEPWTQSGSVTTAGDIVARGPEARAVLGTDGGGVTIGVISDGMDDRMASITSGDLPSDVAFAPIPGFGTGSGDEGTAMLEIIYDIAPAARLMFAAPRTSAEMVAAIDGLATAGAHVVVDDIVFTDEPKFEDGPIAAAARRFVVNGGIYVTAAGNFGQTHYFGRYRPAPTSTLAAAGYRALHQFADADFGNTVRLTPGADVLAILQWSTPFGATSDDLDLVLARRRGDRDEVLAASTVDQGTVGNPIEALRYTNRSGAAIDAYLAIAEFRRDTRTGLSLNVIVASRAAISLERSTPREAVFGHAAVEEVLSVAAVDAARPNRIEGFSSRGPATILFPAPSTRAVPRIAGTSGVETAVGRRGTFANPFRGTSASAPHLAGCAALLLAAGASRDAAVAAMLDTATDLERPGFDRAAGAGRLDCAAAARVASGQVAPPAIAAVQARFDAAGTVVVTVDGEDRDGDVRSATVVLRDRTGVRLATQAAAPVSAGAAFRIAVALRSPRLAAVRSVAVLVRDAAGLTSGETVAAVSCPGDASYGDVLCTLSDIQERLVTSAQPVGGGLIRSVRGVASLVARAGRAAAEGRPRDARTALQQAARRVRRLATRADASGLAAELRSAIGGVAAAVDARLQLPDT